MPVSACKILLSCEISGAVHLAQPGLTAGRLAGRQADEIQVNFENFKVRNIQLVASFNQGTASLQPYQCILAIFLGKTYCKVDFKAQNFQKPYDFVPIPTIKFYRT